MQNRLIILPYAYGGNTGANIQNTDRQFSTYMKNLCVAALSARVNAGLDCDVMVVSNIDIPEPYKQLLINQGIEYDYCAFDQFNFGSTTATGTRVIWQLAFYKLCALAHCVKTMDYSQYCFMDLDVFVQRSFEAIWEEARHNIMLLDVNAIVNDSMDVEMKTFLGCDRCLTHYGGEFFAATKPLATRFVDECQQIFDEMNANGFITKNGDEFITSIAADKLKVSIKNAGAYIRRYWTGSYRLICNDYNKNNIAILHMPAEKEQGIIKLYDKYIAKGIVPDKRKVWRICHLTKPSVRVRAGIIARKLGVVK